MLEKRVAQDMDPSSRILNDNPQLAKVTLKRNYKEAIKRAAAMFNDPLGLTSYF